MDKLVLIDGNSIMNRAFYGIMGSSMLMAPDGTPTNAIYGFLGIMFKILEDINPEYIGIAFDLKAPTKRHKMYEGYKATRHAMPEELVVQMPIIKDVLRSMNIQIIEKEGYEADDILGTLAKAGERNGLDVTILTGDRDAFQLVSDHITIRIPHTKAGKTEEDDFDRKKILEVYGVEPIQMIEVKGLMGDNSDNIPGIDGVGEKTALSIVKEYGSIENLYDKLKKGEDSLKGKLKEKIKNGEEMALLSKELGTIDINVPVDTEISKLRKKEWNKGEVYTFFKNLRLNKYIERFNLQAYKNEYTGNNSSENIGKEISEEKSQEYQIKNIEIVEIDSVENFNKIKTDILKSKIMYFAYSTVDDLSDELIIKKRINSISIYTDKAYVFKDFKNIKNIREVENIESVNNINYVYNKSNISSLRELKAIFENDEILKCSADLKQAYILLKQIGIKPKKFMYDVEIAGYILDSNCSKYDIETLTDKYLGMDISEFKSEEKQMSLFEISDEQNEDNIKANNERLAISSYCVSKLYEILTDKLKVTNQWKLFQEIEMPLVEVLAEMQYVGVYVDEKRLVQLGEDLDKRIRELTDKIYKLSGEEFNVNSTKQLGEVLFEKLKLPTQKKTKSGYSTDSAVLEKLKGEHEIIDALLEYRQISKLKTTFISGILPYINKKTGRIHSNFNQTITSTGRISSSEPNLQNIPTRIELGKNLRKAFVGEGEKIFVDADYSQIELRVLADMANDEKMIRAFEEDKDIHSEVASEVFKTDNVTAEQRSHAKAVNFGIVYGISDFGLAEQLKISKKEAKEYIEKYLSKYCGINEFMENTINLAKENGYVETKFNRRRYIPEINSKNYNVRQFGNRAAMNMPIQGTAADIMKIAMINVYKALMQEKLEAKIILQVHDEIIIETPEVEMEKVKDILVNCMENACKLKVPLKVEVNSGKDWYSAK